MGRLIEAEPPWLTPWPRIFLLWYKKGKESGERERKCYCNQASSHMWWCVCVCICHICHIYIWLSLTLKIKIAGHAGCIVEEDAPANSPRLAWLLLWNCSCFCSVWYSVWSRTLVTGTKFLNSLPFVHKALLCLRFLYITQAETENATILNIRISVRNIAVQVTTWMPELLWIVLQFTLNHISMKPACEAADTRIIYFKRFADNRLPWRANVLWGLLSVSMLHCSLVIIKHATKSGTPFSSDRLLVQMYDILLLSHDQILIQFLLSK